MAWYYAQGSERFGPLTEEQFQQAAGAGTVNSATLVWREGMAQWLPYGQVAGGGVAVAEGGVCSQCRRSFPADDLVMYEGHVVCAECKPTFLQRIREGVIAPVALRYAGFWIRLVAMLFIDGILLGVVQVALAFAVVGTIMFTRNPEAGLTGRLLLLTIINNTISLLYETIMVGRYGATLGKMALGLRVVTPSREPIGYGRSLGRHLAKNLGNYIILIGTGGGAITALKPAVGIGVLILVVGYCMAGFTSQKRALHDFVCGTRVIWKR
jgi:uncharacterized RDD family membrane protein YckC